MKSCTVYCSASDGLETVFTHAARAVGHLLGRRGIDLVFGGGARGLMGEVARGVHAEGGRVIGIITERLHGPERAYQAADELLVVPTMRERKRLLIERGEGVIVLPGGIGTMEEFFEALTGRIVGEHDRPIGMLDVDGFFDPLVAMLRDGIERGFIRPAVMELVQVHRHPGPMLDDMLRHERGPVDEAKFFGGVHPR